LLISSLEVLLLVGAMTSPFAGKDVISTKEIGRETLDGLLTDADDVRLAMERGGVLDVLRGKLLATVFLEPSTRTRLSFQFAMVRAGGQVIDFGLAEAASIAKGETFEDTMRMVDGYSPDVIVVRNRTPGSAGLAADICRAPVVNAGDGSNEHPTQAMLDLYTIKRVRGSIDGVRIGMMGDLAHSRTTSSLSYALDKFDGVQITYIAPKELQVRPEIVASLRSAKSFFAERYEDVVEGLDFLYVTRLQKERFADLAEYERLRGSYQLSRSSLARFKKLPFLMHPLPRVDELSTDLDGLPISKYFDQAQNGVFVRAALIKEILGK
jgi:aspartate carbamoyltransferase catalytic subunit